LRSRRRPSDADCTAVAAAGRSGSADLGQTPVP